MGEQRDASAGMVRICAAADALAYVGMPWFHVGFISSTAEEHLDTDGVAGNSCRWKLSERQEQRVGTAKSIR